MNTASRMESTGGCDDRAQPVGTRKSSSCFACCGVLNGCVHAGAAPSTVVLDDGIAGHEYKIAV